VRSTQPYASWLHSAGSVTISVCLAVQRGLRTAVLCFHHPAWRADDGEDCDVDTHARWGPKPAPRICTRRANETPAPACHRLPCCCVRQRSPQPGGVAVGVELATCAAARSPWLSFPLPRHWPRRRACTTSRPAAHRESSEGHDVVDFKSLAQRRCKTVWCSRTETAPCRAARPAQSGSLPPSPPYPACGLASHSLSMSPVCFVRRSPNTAATRASAHGQQATRAEPQGSSIKQASDSTSPTHCSHALPPPHQHSTALSVRENPTQGSGVQPEAWLRLLRCFHPGPAQRLAAAGYGVNFVWTLRDILHLRAIARAA
jgi:hypothetical protein